jgi:uracil-DNA glycosylase family 4
MPSRPSRFDPAQVQPAGVDRAATLRAVAELAAVCSACERCELARSRQQVVVGRGNPAARLLLIGEAPGAEEDAQGQPFVGRAGRLLEQLLAEAGLDSRRDLYIANVIKCRPPGNRKPSRTELAACRPWLDQQLALMQPELIVLLGATALEALLGIKGGITQLRGQWLQLDGSALPVDQLQKEASHNNHSPGRLPSIMLMPLLHPSYLLRYPSEADGSPRWHTRDDLRTVRQHLDRLTLATT